MALNLAGLQPDLEAFFAAPPATAIECGSQWGTIMEAYASGIVPPSLGVSAAATTLAGALATAFVGGPAAVVPGVEAAFLAFATAVGLGMAPTFTGTPPPAPVGFALEFAKPPALWATTHEDAAILWATMIHTWMTTGIATLVAPPYTPAPWS